MKSEAENHLLSADQERELRFALLKDPSNDPSKLSSPVKYIIYILLSQTCSISSRPPDITATIPPKRADGSKRGEYFASLLTWGPNYSIRITPTSLFNKKLLLEDQCSKFPFNHLNHASAQASSSATTPHSLMHSISPINHTRIIHLPCNPGNRVLPALCWQGSSAHVQYAWLLVFLFCRVEID